MKKRKILSMLLSLTLLLTAMLPVTAAYAEDDKDNGMKISKTAADNKDGTYTITLEAYATGTSVITEEKVDIPTDIILVLDQSGSMENDIGQVSYAQYTGDDTLNKSNYENRLNGGAENLWYPLDGGYVSVSVKRQMDISYDPITNGLNESTRNSAVSLYANRNNLYALVGGAYLKVTVTRTGRRNYTYTYTLPDGTQIASSSGATSAPTISGTDDGKLYLASGDDSQAVYTYTYTDSVGKEQTIGTSTGGSTAFTPAFYQRIANSSGGGSRLAALQNAVATFAEQVSASAKGKDGIYGTDDDVDHRMAIIGFASGSQGNDQYPAYMNTELFIGSNQYNYNSNASSYYVSAFQDMNTQAGYDNIIASKNALEAGGATQVDLGIQMANGIFAAYPIPQNEKRHRVMIVLTDGAPSSWSGYSADVANAAIADAATTKGTYGATVYSIGIFHGANAYSAGKEDGTEEQIANWFMQKLSSNNGTPQTPSYYLSAGDAASLSNIFKQISDKTEEGGSSTTLGESTVIKDIISPQFTLPAGATVNDIKLETYKCTGKNGDEYTWSANNDAMGATAVITSTDPAHETTTQNQVSVTGFDFAENFVGTVTENGVTSYHGNKLVITFVVEPRSGFLGGNSVITNTSAGIYPDGEADKPVLVFDQPQVDVTVKEPEIGLPDACVYLGAYFRNTVNAEDLKKSTIIKFGDNIVLDLNKPDENWGLEDWQTEYVTIEAKVTDKDGNEITDFDKLTEDTEYLISVSIKPKTEREGNNGWDKSTTGTLYVFKPELTFIDSTAYYGEAAPIGNDYGDNFVTVSEKWENEGKHSTDKEVKMLGEKPDLDIAYTPDSTKLDNGRYTKLDVPVRADVSINSDNVNEYTKFLHECGMEECAWTEPKAAGDPAFLIHILTCTLDITKQGGADNESYVFDVFRDGVKYTEVTVWGNGTETITELPVGTYTVAENAGWSWRYSAGNGGAELTSDRPADGIICLNTKTENRWLNGFSTVVRNIFGTGN